MINVLHINHLGGTPRALVIAPTRELVIQICKDADAIGKYCGLRSLAIYGGMDYDRQKKEVSMPCYMVPTRMPTA